MLGRRRERGRREGMVQISISRTGRWLYVLPIDIDYVIYSGIAVTSARLINDVSLVVARARSQ